MEVGQAGINGLGVWSLVEQEEHSLDREPAQVQFRTMVVQIVQVMLRRIDLAQCQNVEVCMEISNIVDIVEWINEFL